MNPEPRRSHSLEKLKRLSVRRNSVTVAIAAICTSGGPMIVAAEDHMITAGDVEFEQPQPKIWSQGPYAIAMMYGDSAAQAEIAVTTEAAVVQHGIMEVEEIARRYFVNLMSYVQRSAEATILSPLQLSAQSFLSNSKTMHQGLIDRLRSQLQDHYFDSGMFRSLGGAIITGIDTRGGHIYRVEHGGVTQLDRVGFVAAGSGQWHAESQFMFSRYTRDWDLPEALSLVYAAKKRAEVAPGVGVESDIVLIFSNPLNTVHFRYDTPLVKGLEEIYTKSRAKHEEATQWQHQEVRNFMNKAIQDEQAKETSKAKAEEKK